MELLIRPPALATILLLCSCIHENDSKPGKVVNGTRPRHIEKPASARQDTMKIEVPSAVFFYPDSTQLNKVKNTLDTSVYKAIMHDYFYQMRYAEKVVRDSWPALAAIDARNCRYLLFVKRDKSRKCIDLDKTKELYGVCLFDGNQDPVFADMPNINTALGFYLKDQ